MKALKVVLLIFGLYALLHAATQSLRHAFVAFLDPQSSIIAKLDPVKAEISETTSQEQLVTNYQQAQAKVAAWNEGKAAEEIRQATYGDQEPHHSAELLREAIEAREQQARQLREVHFYWWTGMGCLVLAIGCWYRVDRWLGVGLLMVAFTEMLYWTSPEFRLWSAGDEFSRLVSWKLIYSVGTLAVLLGLWVGLWIPMRQESERSVGAA